MDTNLKAWITRKNGQWEVSLNVPDWVYDDIIVDGENNTGLVTRQELAACPRIH